MDMLKSDVEENAYVNQGEGKINGNNVVDESLDINNTNSEKSNTMERKKVEFTDDSIVSLVDENTKILNGNPFNEDMEMNGKKGASKEVKMTEEEINASLNADDGVILEGANEIDIVPMKNGRKPFLRSGTLPQIKKSIMNIPKRSNTLLKKMKTPSIKLPDGKSATLNFQNREMHVVKNVNTLHIPTKKELKNGLNEFKTSLKKRPLTRVKTMPAKANYQRNGDNVSIGSDSILNDSIVIKRAPPPRPNYGPSQTEDIIAPTASSSLNAEIDIKSLNPTRFQHNSHYNSQTLSYNATVSPKKKSHEIDFEENSRKFNIYLDKLRKKISEGAKTGTIKSNGKSEAHIQDRQEVYAFSFKNRSLNKRMTSVNKSNTLIQPIVSRPKLQETLRNANDPEFLDKYSTMERSKTLSPEFNSEFYGSMRKDDKLKIGGAYFQQKAHEIETQGSPYYGEKLRQNLPKDMLKPEAMEKTNPFVDYMKYMKKVEYSSISNAQDSDVKHLQAYLDASLDLKNAELRPEYMNFFVAFSSLNPRKYIDMGSLVGWRELKVLRSTENSLDYIKLLGPRIVHMENTIAYPLISIDSMLTTWLEKKSTIPDNVDELKPTHQDLLHTLSYMSTLNDIGNCIEASETNRLVISLSVLLSLNYCLQTYPEFLIDADPSKILIVGAPTNSLVIFRLKQPQMTALESEKILETYKGVFDILKIEKRESMEQILDDLISVCHVSLHQEMQDQAEFSLKLLKCISPPDWTAVCMSRVGLKKLKQS